MTPLAIDLFCGLGGWTEGLLAEGYRVVGFDNERHHYGEAKYPAQLVLQDVLTIHGSQFKDAALIVASPPCQAYSYRAMPWKRAKALPPPDNSLFEACFRIQREACEAARRFIPLVVENVRGAQPWVGRSRWHYGSFHLWGDVPALMPITKRAPKMPGRGMSLGDVPWGPHHTGPNEKATKNTGGSWFAIGSPGQKETGRNPVHRLISEAHRSKSPAKGYGVVTDDGLKQGLKGENGGWFNDDKRKGGTETGRLSRSGSKSSARKSASAHIAKIPLPLARHIARAWHPSEGV